MLGGIGQRATNQIHVVLGTSDCCNIEAYGRFLLRFLAANFTRRRQRSFSANFKLKALPCPYLPTRLVMYLHLQLPTAAVAAAAAAASAVDVHTVRFLLMECSLEL